MKAPGGSYIPLGPFLFSSLIRQKDGNVDNESDLRKRLALGLQQKRGQKENDKFQNISDY